MKNSFPKKQLGSEQVYFRLSHTQIGQKNAGFCRMDRSYVLMGGIMAKKTFSTSGNVKYL